ncbi:DUF5691 domain-containing protein [Chitinophaga solisilvae]|uniref:DUF5691 domain-containing protein n=1 Tax=Chitinophaga solisilvae TaxID=1233460 RepID=UPI0013712A21|nr:DUF5691 domain-containing protein [Chitinophaga solisilvae]
MQYWNNIINTAMLGTAKKPADTHGLPQGPLLDAAMQILATPALDREDQLLHIAAVTYNYRQSGVQALSSTGTAPVPVCDPEDKPYCSSAAIKALQQALDTDNHILPGLWLEYCAAAQQLVPPDYLPLVLETAYRHKALRVRAAACCGKRGEWLAQFNNEWNFSVVTTSLEDQWQNGTTAQRLIALKTLRDKEPATALSWLRQTWTKENAAAKTELLGALQHHIGPDDAPWLESLMLEKSKQVREEALLLLKKIPEASLHELYLEVLRDAVQINDNGDIICTLPENINEQVFRSGIEKLSSNKNVPDTDYIIGQLIGFVHPRVWEKHFNCSFEEVVQRFHQQQALQPFIVALVNAITWFSDHKRAATFMRYSDTFYMDLLPLLPEEQQEAYSLQYFDKYPTEILEYALQQPATWSPELALKILQYCAGNPYIYNQSYMSNTVGVLPVSMVDQLEGIESQHENYKTYWKSIMMHLTGLLQTRILITKAFPKS